MEGQLFRIFVVDDYEPWRRFVTATLQARPGLLIVGEASDGVKAVETAQQLQPDLILLDIGLPMLNGMEAARQIRKLAPKSKILFASENRSWDIAEEALGTGALGYLVKSDAASELLPGVLAALAGKQFLSVSLASQLSTRAKENTVIEFPRSEMPSGEPGRMESIGRHEVQFYSEDQQLLRTVSKFVETALNAGHAAVVVATESHRRGLVPRLQACDADMDLAVQQGRYIVADTADALATFMSDGIPDRVRFLEGFGTLIQMAAASVKGQPPRVAVYGECVQVLCEQGNGEAAIEVEKLTNQLMQTYPVDILCGYSLNFMHTGGDAYFERIRAEHSAAYSG